MQKIKKYWIITLYDLYDNKINHHRSILTLNLLSTEKFASLFIFLSLLVLNWSGVKMDLCVFY